MVSGIASSAVWGEVLNGDPHFLESAAEIRRTMRILVFWLTVDRKRRQRRLPSMHARLYTYSNSDTGERNGLSIQSGVLSPDGNQVVELCYS
jgi:hypothetical protein